MLLNLGLARSGEPSTFERLLWTVPPATAAKRHQADPAETVPTSLPRKPGLLAGFEKMMSAYADLAIRGLRD